LAAGRQHDAHFRPSRQLTLASEAPAPVLSFSAIRRAGGSRYCRPVCNSEGGSNGVQNCVSKKPRAAVASNTRINNRMVELDGHTGNSCRLACGPICFVVWPPHLSRAPLTAWRHICQARSRRSRSERRPCNGNCVGAPAQAPATVNTRIAPATATIATFSWAR
jgi:hypothetical protein